MVLSPHHKVSTSGYAFNLDKQIFLKFSLIMHKKIEKLLELSTKVINKSSVKEKSKYSEVITKNKVLQTEFRLLTEKYSIDFLKKEKIKIEKLNQVLQVKYERDNMLFKLISLTGAFDLLKSNNVPDGKTDTNESMSSRDSNE